MNNKLLSLLWIIVSAAIPAMAQHVYTVDTRPGTAVQPTAYGIFFEDINFGADGGLYAELVANRSFECPNALSSWQTIGNVRIGTDRPAFSRNPHYAILESSGHAERKTMIENHGYFGMGLRKGMTYGLSLYGRVNDGGTSRLVVQLVGNNGKVQSHDTLTIDGTPWKCYKTSLRSETNDAGGYLRILLVSPDGCDIDHISLMPDDNWNGLRSDLVADLADLHPGVFRFPGGCIVEGADLATRYQWKNTVGAVEDRPQNENRWAYSYSNKYFPSYYQSYGLGFYEYFLLAEHIGAEPLPVLNCGMACQYQNRNPKNVFDANVPVEDLQPYINDALDLIEFANGSVTSAWGRLRAEMGHPKPFNLKYIAIGNEQWGALYPERLEPIIKAVRKKYPDIKIIGSSGPSADGSNFKYGWNEMRRLKADLVDEHYYKDPNWFLNNARRYDKYDRKGPKVFAGEYACKVRSRRNTFESALAEAAFMTGLDRNSDIVHMATYAPLFANANGYQWSPDLIWFDNMTSVRTPNWYVQQIFSTTHGTHKLTLTEDGHDIAGEDSLYASATWDKDTRQIVVKVVNASLSPRTITLRFKGSRSIKPKSALAFHGNDNDENSLRNKSNIVPKDINAPTMDGNSTQVVLPGRTFGVYTFTK